MSDLNCYSFTGRLGANPETRYTASGAAIWSARVAVGYGYGDKGGTNWLTVQVFGKRAEGLAKLELAKGTLIAGKGELRVREYERKDGGKGTAVEVAADDIALLGKREEVKPTQQVQRSARATQGASDFADDDIPFAPLGKRTHWIA